MCLLSNLLDLSEERWKAKAHKRNRVVPVWTRVFCICSLTTNMQFRAKTMRRPWAARRSPHIPVFEVTSPSAWLAICSRRRSAPNAPKTQSSKEKCRKETLVYSSHVGKEQLRCELTSHRSSQSGRSSIENQRCRSGRGVGRQ